MRHVWHRQKALGVHQPRAQDAAAAARQGNHHRIHQKRGVQIRSNTRCEHLHSPSIARQRVLYLLSRPAYDTHWPEFAPQLHQQCVCSHFACFIIACVLCMHFVCVCCTVLLPRIHEAFWVWCAGAFYLRLTGRPLEVYQYLEPLYNDNRKVRLRSETSFELSHVDELVDDMLRKDYLFDIALPRLPARWVRYSKRCPRLSRCTCMAACNGPPAR